MKKSGICRAHTNIALIKYWGKKDEDLFIPMNSSLSLTLSAFYTDTKVTFDSSLTKDQLILNGKILSDAETKKISNFLDLFRTEFAVSEFAVVESYNHVPTAAGLASSASAFAALAGATNKALELNLDPTTLSTFARRGSGSATRSIFGGFVKWQQGTDHASSHAIPIDDGDWDIGMIILVINGQEKKVSSREGMKRTLRTSPFYPAWVEAAQTELKQMEVAIQQHDFEQVGKIMEANSYKMHATMLGANPPFTYFEPATIQAMQKVQKLREQGFSCYFTMDAGPNVKILCRKYDMSNLKERLLEDFSADQIILSDVGQGLKYLSETEWTNEKGR